MLMSVLMFLRVASVLDSLAHQVEKKEELICVLKDDLAEQFAPPWAWPPPSLRADDIHTYTDDIKSMKYGRKL